MSVASVGVALCSLEQGSDGRKQTIHSFTSTVIFLPPKCHSTYSGCYRVLHQVAKERMVFVGGDNMCLCV